MERKSEKDRQIHEKKCVAAGVGVAVRPCLLSESRPVAGALVSSAANGCCT